MSFIDKERDLIRSLRQLDGAVLAFSGGVDSSYLLAAGCEALDDRILAVIGRSPSYPRRELDRAIALAEWMGAAWRMVETDEMSDPSYVANSPHRCYHCKSALFRTLVTMATEEGFDVVIEGSNADDLSDHRPGRWAASELEVRSPLAEVGLTKGEIRELSRRRGLPTWNKPAYACLASRIPYGVEVTTDRLQRIERAEAVLHDMGLEAVRVRDHGEVARVEVESSALARLLEPGVREAVVAGLKRVGFHYVALDLEGYRTGSLNEALVPDVETPGGAGG